jgi:tagaturonate reductase
MRLNKKTYGKFRTYPEKVLQFGEGNFLRAFVDWQVDKMNEDGDFNGSVVVVQPREHGKIHELVEQDCLYTVYLQGIQNGKALRTHKIVNSISRGINPYKEYDEYLKIGENPELKFVVSNTTEAGIAFDETDKLEGGCQKSFPGKLAAFLYHRFKVFNGDSCKGLIIIPCELIDRNGEKLKEIILRYAYIWKLGNEFTNWIDKSNTFCCSLVDRIVSGYPKDTIEEITKEVGYEDKLVDVGEIYHSWIIEGPQSLKDELPIEKAGLNIKIVDDITPYRTSKVRILNGPHTAMVPVAYLYGLETVGESVGHEIIGKYINGLIYEEIIETLDLPHKELIEFADAIIERFQNPYINHYLMSIALNSMSKFRTRNLPSLTEYLKRKGQLPKKLTFSFAALIEFYKGKRGEENIELADDEDILELYKNLWNNYDGTSQGLRKIVISILEYEKIWGSDLNQIHGLTDEITKYLEAIEKVGIKEAIKIVL